MTHAYIVITRGPETQPGSGQGQEQIRSRFKIFDCHIIPTLSAEFMIFSRFIYKLF